MNKINTEKLISSFPNLYPKMHPLYPESEQISFHFECGDGWFELLWDISAKLDAEIATIKLSQSSTVDGEVYVPYAVQVKEKYGTLRFYMSSATVTMRNAILEAENRSAVTCEVCGEHGKLRGGGWVSTLCDKHAKK